MQVQHKGTYICKSVLDPSIKKEVTLQLKGFVNKFSNERKSFMVLPMKTDSSSFGLDVTFRPENPNGKYKSWDEITEITKFCSNTENGHISLNLRALRSHGNNMQ